MENQQEKGIKMPPPLPPPLPPIEQVSHNSTTRAIMKPHELTEKQKSIRRVLRFSVAGIALLIIAGAGISKFVQSSNTPANQVPSAPSTTTIASDSGSSMKDNTIEQEDLENGNEQAWQAVLSPQFKAYRENDDVPGQIERYKDDLGHSLITEAWSRNIQSDDRDSSIIEALAFVFSDQQKVTKTKDTLFVSTGVQELSNQERAYYYIVYCPKFMQSYSLYSMQADTLFATYSERLIETVRAMKSSN